MKSWLRAWKKAWASRGAFGNGKRHNGRRRDLRFESLESRELLSIVSVVAKDPVAGEDPVGGQNDTGQAVVTRDVVDSNPLTVTVELGGTATVSSDYSTSPNYYYDFYSGTYRVDVTIPANESSAAVTITPVNDGAKESTEKVTLTAIVPSGCGCCCGGGNYTVGTPSSDSVTIADNDNWQVKIEANDAVAGEQPTDSGQFTVTRFGVTDTSNSLDVYYWIEGTATHGTDYSSLPNAVYDFMAAKWRTYSTIAAGAATATVNINVTDDAATEGSETTTLSLTTNTGCGGPVVDYSISAPGQVSVTIADNDGSNSWQAKIEAAAATAFEPGTSSGASTPGRFRVTRYNATDASQAVTVNYSVSGTATGAGTDYATLSGSVTIPANATEAYIDVDPSYDGLGNDNNETVILTLGTGTGYTVGSPSSDTVLIDDTGANGAADSAATTGELGGDHDGALKLAVPDAGLVWLSSDDPRPIVSADVHLQPTSGQATLSTVEASLTLGGVQSGTVYYDGSQANANDLYRFSLQVDASSLATGRYDWSITITQRYSDQSSQTDTYSGQRDIVNRAASPFGKSWTLGFLDRLFQNSRGVLLVRADGGTAFFNSTTTTGQYAAEAGHPQFDKLLGNWTDGFTLTYKDGSQQKFNAAGILTSASDPLGNTTTWSYTDADSDGQTDDPTQMVDPANHTTSFSYTSGRLSTITDFAGRVTTLGYDGSARLTSITLPDPDGGGPLASPVWQFGYHATTHLLTSQTDPANKTTSYAYDMARTLQTITHPDSETDTLRAVQVRALVDTGAGQGTQGNPAGLFRAATIEGSREDELDRELFFTTGRFARVTSLTDAAGNVTTYEYNDQGQVTKITEPDPDGAGPLTSPVTQYQYDSSGNLTQITLPDSSTQSWTYNTTFNKPTSFTDELSHQTLYTLDSLTGNTVSVRRVVGQVDDPQNGETDDVVTSYTYTAAPASSSDPPAGLVATDTDPLSRVTRYIYNAHGLTTMIVYAVGTADQAVVQYGYDSADNLTSQTDELGRTTTFAYDSLGRRTSTTQPDPDGGGPLSAPVTTYEYDAVGRLTKETDPLGRDTQYTYNDLGRTTQVSRPDHDNNGQRTNTSYAYTSTGQVYTVTDPLGRVTTYGYNALDRLTSVTQPDPDGGGPLASPVTQYGYDNLGRLTQVTDPLSRVTTFEYNSRGWKTKMTQPDPDGGGPLTAPVWQYGYNAVGNQTTETDPLSNVTTRAYDALNRLASVTQPDPDGGGPLTAPVTQYGYDKAGDQTSVTDPLSRVTTYSYDNRNRQTQRTLPDPDGGGPLTSPIYKTSYDRAGQVVSETDPLSQVTSFQYDNLGRRTQITQPDPDGGGPLSSPVTQYAYDAVGNLTSITDPLSRVTQNSYDPLYNLVQVTLPDPDGEGPLTAPVTSYVYDAAQQLTSQTDPQGYVTSFQYDNLGRKTTTTEPDPDGGGPLGAPVTQYTYDAVGNMLTLTDPTSNQTAWTYDNLNRQITETNQLSQSRSFVYDAIGHLTKKTDRNGRVIEYTFDNLGRETAEVWKNGETTVRTISFVYDVASELTSASDPDANYTYGYDNMGRTTSIVVTITGLTPSVGLNQTFDAASRRTQAAFAFGVTNDLVNNYTFDNLGRMTQVQQTNQQGGNAVAPKRVDFAYDAASQWQSIDRYADLAGTQLVATSSYTFDNDSRLTALSHDKGGNNLAGYTWTYDSAGRVTQFVSTTDGTANYSYDNTDQVTGATYNYQTNESYSYDANGNRTNTGYSTGSDNRMTSDGTYRYTYDAEGNCTAKFVDVNTNGQLDSGDTNITEYTWDYRNRLTNVTERATYGGATTKVTDFAYDYLNRLVSEAADPDGAGAQGAQSAYYAYDGNQIVLRFDGSSATNLTNRYLWGPVVDQILADEQVTSLSSPGTVVWPLTDNLGTIRDLVTYDSQNDITTVANHRVYDAYGKLTSQTNPAVDHLFGFTGRQYDKATALQNNLNRWYDPAVGRWLSRDPIGFEAQDTNLYRYVGNTPTVETDPLGLDPACAPHIGAGTQCQPYHPGGLPYFLGDSSEPESAKVALLTIGGGYAVIAGGVYLVGGSIVLTMKLAALKAEAAAIASQIALITATIQNLTANLSSQYPQQVQMVQRLIYSLQVQLSALDQQAAKIAQQISNLGG